MGSYFHFFQIEIQKEGFIVARKNSSGGFVARESSFGRFLISPLFRTSNLNPEKTEIIDHF